jgi:hypothetical protein
LAHPATWIVIAWNVVFMTAFCAAVVGSHASSWWMRWRIATGRVGADEDYRLVARLARLGEGAEAHGPGPPVAVDDLAGSLRPVDDAPPERDAA